MYSQWNAISDKLPDDFEYVLISCVDEYNPRMRYIPIVGYIKNNMWYTYDCSSTNNMANYFKARHLVPTHWMDLPKSP